MMMSEEAAEEGAAPMQLAEPEPRPSPREQEQETEVFSADLLSMYYNRLFPFSLMYRWLCYGNDPDDSSCEDPNFFRKRELSMTLEGDIYLRYRCFRNKDEFRNALRTQRPIKIDLGAYYNVPPSMKNSVAAFVPVEKEFVIDIDLTDYDDVRKCCSGASICLLCWKLICAAVAVLDAALREDFGFEHLLWVYSGRRGIHCWVCDKRARVLSTSARSKVASYLHLYEGNSNTDNKIMLSSPIHPCFDRALEKLLPVFEDIFIKKQGLLGDSDKWNDILKFLPEDLAAILRRNFSSKKFDSMYRWTQVKNLLETEIKKARNKLPRSRKQLIELDACLYRLVFSYVYPRLDINVSKQLNHLLKSPFVAHPKTGRVCVPVDPERIDDFNPLTVPHLGQLNSELVKNDTEEVEGAAKGDNHYARRTSLRPYLSFFQKSFVEPIEASIRQERQKANASSNPVSW